MKMSCIKDTATSTKVNCIKNVCMNMPLLYSQPVSEVGESIKMCLEETSKSVL